MIGVIVLLLVGVMIIQYATPSRTVDFRGEILFREEDVYTVKSLKIYE